MNIKQIADAAFFAKRCRLLNHWIEIRGIEILILALVEGREEPQLWYMARNPYRNPEGDNDPNRYEYIEPATHRERLCQNMMRDSHEVDLSFRTIALGAVEFAVESTTSSSCYDENFHNWMALQYFFEQGLDLSKWNDVEGFNIQLAYASVVAGKGIDPFVALENVAITEIVLETNMVVTQRALSEPLKFSIGLGEVKTVSYNDPITGTQKQIHLNGVAIHDFWASVEASFKPELPPDMPEDLLQGWISERETGFEGICPKGKMLAMLEYQEERGLQLAFYDTAYLESPYMPEETACAFFFGSDNKAKGPNGYRYMLARLRPVAADETGPFDVELLSVYEHVNEACFRFTVS